jgi:hypothetical protein
MGYNVEEYELWEGDKKLCDAFELENGKCVVSWCGEISSIVVYDKLNDFAKISLHGERQLKRYDHRCFTDVTNSFPLSD